MNEIEMKQFIIYMYPLLKSGFSDKYLKKMGSLNEEDVSSNLEIVFSSEEMCDKELFAAILVSLKTAPTYYVIDSYRLITIDSNKVADKSFTSLYDLTAPEILFIRCGISDIGLTTKLTEYIGNCIDIIVDARRTRGLRTYIFNYGTKETFKKYGCDLLMKFANIRFTEDEVM